ncbi:polyisoprenoid-binding protein YceI [Nitrospirillum amazonense]|uniref:Polyisoprenoid-binding protein YceI n=1 Tax=Nitrospirillum amazonense TaxID=28077 RepID=A0A560FT09_9PROT|nr:YceI family protein [Nitrospirillum amazonense]TWB24776.1 polyisoprenoid-binding protein YceI [Nitrospirillum amazonense]
MTLRPSFLIPALAVLLLSPLLLAAPAGAASWVVDKAQSQLGFIGHQSDKEFTGRFGRWDAAVDFDPADPTAGHAKVTIAMGSAVIGDAEKDQALPGEDWFNIQAFPDAVFEATTFRAKGGNQYDAVGTLTIRGIKKDVTLPFTLDITEGKAHAVGRLDLVRTDYDVGGHGLFSKGRTVDLNVAVVVDLMATAQP